MGLYIGTSGWAYREWRPGFYPEGLPQREFLAYYSGALTACEVNATFYRLQSRETLAGWAAATPEPFRFAAKAHRRLTHSRGSLDEAALAFLARFLETLGALGTRLGPVLFQFPPARARDEAALEALIAALPDGLAWAAEFRHPSWSDPAVTARVADAGGTVCMADFTGEVPERLPPGRIAYVRMRADRYGDDVREGWRALLVREAATRDVFAFAKHEGVPAGDPHVGVGLAEWLMARSRG